MYTPKTFNIPKLIGISEKNIEEHMNLYKGYVTNVNLIEEKLAHTSSDDAYTRAELTRRYAFEFCGMRNHELYFSALEDGPSVIPVESRLFLDIVRDFGGTDEFINRVKEVALTRGIGWAVLSYDGIGDKLILSWVDEQHIGQLAHTFPVYAIDMWEHAYVGDYWSSGKKNYVQDYIDATNFKKIADRYENFLTTLKPL